MSTRISGPMQKMVRNLNRRFKSGQGLGEKWKSTNGLLQGCPLAVVALNMVVHVWARTMREELPNVTTGAFADDTKAATKKAENLEAAATLTEEFVKASYQELNGGKTITWALGSYTLKAAVKAIRVQGEKTNFVQHFRDLGAHISTNLQASIGCVGDRRKSALNEAKKCQVLPTTFTNRANTVAAKSGSKALYRCEITRMSKTARTTQRAAATLGCWKKKRKLRSPKIVMALLAPGPRMDPDLAIPGRAIALLRRTLSGMCPSMPSHLGSTASAGTKQSQGPGPCRDTTCRAGQNRLDLAVLLHTTKTQRSRPPPPRYRHRVYTTQSPRGREAQTLRRR